MRWFQRVKDKEFESNSQQGHKLIPHYECWFQRVKDKEFESNSQRKGLAGYHYGGWFQRVKDKEFESNSLLNLLLISLRFCYPASQIDYSGERRYPQREQEYSQYHIIFPPLNLK